MKKIRLFFLLICISLGSFAQNWGEYDPYIINSSLGGNKDMFVSGLSYNESNTAFENHPKKLMAWGNGLFTRQVAGGFRIKVEQVGVIQHIAADFSFIYKIPIRDFYISASLDGGFRQYSLNVNERKILDYEPDHSESLSGSSFNANVGFSISKVNKFYVGLFVSNLVPNQTNWLTKTFENQIDINYNLATMYTFHFNNIIHWEWTGYISTSMPDNSNAFEYGISNRVIFKKDFWLSTGYQNESTFRAGIGMNIHTISVAYATYYSFGDVAKYGYSFTQHEIVLLLRIPYSKSSKSTGSWENYYFC